MEEAMKTAEQSFKTQASGVDDLFGEIQASQSEDVYAHFRQVKPWSMRRQLQEEKDSLGLWLSGHPIEDYLPEIRRMTRYNIANLTAGREIKKVIGLIHDIRYINSNRGNNMAIVTLDDRSARIDVTLYSDLLEQYREDLRKDEVIMVEGTAMIDEYRGDGSLQMRVKSLMPFQQARQQYARNITVNLTPDRIQAGLDVLQEILNEYRCGDDAAQEESPCEIVVHYEREGVRGDIMLGKEWRVALHDDLLTRLRQQYGEQHIALNY
jgi:DNA polymerase-3 subunit alpha